MGGAKKRRGVVRLTGLAACVVLIGCAEAGNDTRVVQRDSSGVVIVESYAAA